VKSADEMAARCTRFLQGHGRRLPKARLAEIGEEVTPDTYGQGGVVEELELELAELLGKPAVVFMPSGTMAQQIALRIHADRRGRRGVAFHPACHLLHHEELAYQELHHLTGVPVGEPDRLIDLADLEGIKEQPAALLLELPQRDIGGQLPEFAQLEAQVGWARERGAAVHMDGARIWEATPYYNRSLAELAALFDTVYVSFYKGLGAIAGCCLAGPEDIIDAARTWRARHGGRVVALWPYAASAKAALHLRLSRMPDYYRHALAIAASLQDLEGVQVVPSRPQAPMMHLLLNMTAAELEGAASELAEAEAIWTWARPFQSALPAQDGLVRVEFVVGDGTMMFSPEEVREIVGGLVNWSGPPATLEQGA
jgi:threonine aldolase